MASIRLATASNFRTFQNLVDALVSNDGRWREQLDQEALEDEFGRLRVWSGNLGALQKGHSSLDYRLRDSPLLSGNALKFLEELNQNLHEAHSIVSGTRLPYEDQSQPDSAEELDEDNDDGFFSEDDDDDEEAASSKKELTMRYEEIVDIIDNLYKLSVRIRTPTIRSRSLKAASYQPKDPETGVDILSTYALYDKQHTEELLRYLRQPHIPDAQTDDGCLASRLAHAVTLRRRQFKYWKRHREKLSVSTILEETAVRAERPVEQINVPSRNNPAEAILPQPVIFLKEAPSQRTGKTMLSGTEATHHHQSLDDIVDSKSVTSYAVTVTDIHGKGVNLPPPPKSADGERDFECPYCYIICPARYGRGRAWRTHLLQDLQPYVCTYPDCEASEQLFRSRREWNEHEASHRKAWRCPEHPSAIYRSRIGLEDHLRQQHLDSFPESQLDTIVKIGETSTVETREKCPVCFLSADAEGMGDFANHVANHLERFAAFALPNNSEEDTDGAGSAASRGRSRSTASQDVSDMSLPSDISEEEQSGGFVTELQRSDEEPLVYEREPQEGLQSYSLLSAESLLSLPDASQNRLDALLAHHVDEQDDDLDEDTDTMPADIQEQMERIESFRAYMLSLPGAQTVRFFRRYGSWRGNAIFGNGTQAAQALGLFDESLWPQVNIRQGTESNRNKLKFSVPNTETFTRTTPVRRSTSATQDADNKSISSASIDYDDEATVQAKADVLSVSDIPALRELYRTRKLLQRDQSYPPNDSYNRIISFCYHDLTRIKVDAIVNSANNSMKVSKNATTLNYSVHKAGGPKLSEEARLKGKLKSGQAALTGGHNLPCDYVIHASRPQYSSNKGMGQFNILTECYRSALKIALVQGIRSVAFPCLGAGGCGFPPRVAARVALQEVREFMDSQVKHPFEQIVFVVNSAWDEKAYMDLLPVFFPPTHGDLEVAGPPEWTAIRAALAAQALETRLQVQKVVEELSAELSLFIPDFPTGVLEELQGIDSALASMRGFLLGPSALRRSSEEDLNLLCFVMQTVCGGITELTETAKDMPFSGGRSHKGLWDDYNNHMKMAHHSDVEQFLKDCQNFAQCLDDILTRNGVELDEMTPMRLRLDSFKAKQRGQDTEGVRDRFDEVLYTREFQRENITQSREIVRLHQISSITQLYSSKQLEEKSTMARPSVVFNDTVCLVREDITKLEVTVLVNSTDVSFAGMGTLDRKVFNKGGLELRQELNKFGVCKEGDVKTTPGYLLSAKYVLHVVPPEQYRKNSKDVLRQIYREILHTAQSLGATSIAIPSIGTGMLNYPRRDCASLALEEIHRFLETAEPTNSVEKIVLAVYSANDEFVYRSLLPVYFPPINQSVNRALPASHPIPTSPREQPKTISAPKRTLFSSIGDAVRNLGSSRFGKRPVSHTSRAINSYEEHALIGFESHAQDCTTCKTMKQLYLNGGALCEHGYPLAQTLLWYMTLGPDQLVYTRPVQIRQSIRLEVPEDMFPLSLTLLSLVEASLREEGREHPFVSPNRAYSTIIQGQTEKDDATDLTIYGAEKASARVEVWSGSENLWSPVSPGECVILVRPRRIDVYEAHAPVTTQKPLLTLELNVDVEIARHVYQPGLIIRGAVVSQLTSLSPSSSNGEIRFVSQSTAASNALLAMLHRANPEFPVTREDLNVASHDVEGTKKQIQEAVEPLGKPSDKIESDSERDIANSAAQQSEKDTQQQVPSPLQVKMQRLSAAASHFNIEPYEHQSAIVDQLGDDTVLPGHAGPSSRVQVGIRSSDKPLTTLEQQVLHYLTEDLKSRPGSYIGQNTKGIASALNKRPSEISTATESLSQQNYIHNTIDKWTWVVSQAPTDLPALGERLSGVPIRQTAPPSTIPSLEKANETDKADLLFQMDLLEQQVMSYFTHFNSGSPLEQGCKSQDIAKALDKDVDEVELVLDQLAEQGKLHLAPDGETWNMPLPRQHIPSKSEDIRNATEFRDTPPSPVIPALSAEAQNTPIDIVDAADLGALDVDDPPPHPGTRWTRIDKAYVDPRVLANLDEEFHEEGYSLIVHRVLRRGELKQWVQKTLELRLQRTDVAREREGA
ncbi:uncharacterized protein EKO05_0003127 [Ascochyta rabiei]|uniref:Macro domain-containing protein n=1 Tax=Didymella rabiei TaxID=5454 RepID=A0A163BL84_DIDRA|nr:uncharacterized protein EKO05_0003127 [Ascochyta rabiei]KZM21834.1 hypothetical protein ST47_g7013 [Ascochyta rabiei]UPX12583.1 hypothetical protein EKO05_0003127 [Ascochyta rabiei]